MELENKLENNINNELEKEQKNFFDTTFGKIINKALDFRVKSNVIRCNRESGYRNKRCFNRKWNKRWFTYGNRMCS